MMYNIYLDVANVAHRSLTFVLLSRIELGANTFALITQSSSCVNM